jgi:hypothetical protein
MATAGAPHSVIGFSCHTGWAAAVAVAGPRDAPRVAAKVRVTLATTFEAGAVFHAGQGLAVEEARAFIEASEERFVALARVAVAALLAELRGRGLEPVAGAVLVGADRPLPALETILRSHALVHAAEGAFYRQVIGLACEACRLPAARVPARDLVDRAARTVRLPEDEVLGLLDEAGRASGRPWAKDQKDAALAAWITLATSSSTGAARRPRPGDPGAGRSGHRLARPPGR